MVDAKNFVTIQGFMRTELNLKGNDLLVYAIIYGFSQTPQQRFTGSLQYLADWCGATKQGIQKNLKNLMERGLIKREETLYNNVVSVVYYTTELHGGIQLSCTNNIDNNKNNTNSKELVEDKPKRKNLFEKCVDEINNFCTDEELRELLVTFLKMRLEMRDKPIYVNQWRGLLNRLQSEWERDRSVSMDDIVRQSIERGYASFYPVKKYDQPTRRINLWDNAVSEGYTDLEKERLKELDREREQHGIRTKF